MYRTAKEGSPDNLNIKKDKNRNPPPPPPERGSYADFTLACDLSFERSIFSPMLSRGRVHHPLPTSLLPVLMFILLDQEVAASCPIRLFFSFSCNFF